MKQYLIIFFVFFLCSCHKRPVIKSGLEGNIMPDFHLLLIDSSSYMNTGSIPSGKPTVLFYFSPKCPYCKAQTKSIISHEKSLRGIQFVLVTSAPYGDFKKFYNKYELNKYPNIIAGVDQHLSFARYFKAAQVPYLAVYNKERRLKQVTLGKIFSSEIKDIAFN